MTDVRRATPADADVLARLLWDFNTEFRPRPTRGRRWPCASPGCSRSTTWSRCSPRTRRAVGFALLSCARPSGSTARSPSSRSSTSCRRCATGASAPRSWT